MSVILRLLVLLPLHLRCVFAGPRSFVTTGSENCNSTETHGAGQSGVLDDSPAYWLSRCNIRRVAWPGSFGMLTTAAEEPYIVKVPAGRNTELSQMLVRQRLLADMGDMDCTPSQAGPVRKGIHSMRLRDYVQDWMVRDVNRNPELNRYVFGEFGEEWAPFRNAYVLPQCRACTVDRVAITIGLGGLYSGAPWHFHDAAFVEVLHGKKHFAFLQAEDPAVPLINDAIQNLSQLHWYMEERPTLEAKGLLREMQECTINSGELLFFPPYWHHGVVNLDPYTAFVSTFLDQKARTDS